MSAEEERAQHLHDAQDGGRPLCAASVSGEETLSSLSGGRLLLETETETGAAEVIRHAVAYTLLSRSVLLFDVQDELSVSVGTDHCTSLVSFMQNLNPPEAPGQTASE